MIKKILFAITLCTLLISCGKKPIKDDYGCFVNYEDTLDYADQKKLPILLFFTSEGDDEESTQIVSDVFKDQSFAIDILNHYAVCHADFSQKAFAKMNASDNADAEEQELANTYTTVMQTNYQLAMLFNVDSMPAVFLCTKEGFVVTRLDSENSIWTMNDFKSTLEYYSEELTKFNSLVAKASKGSNEAKIETIDELYNATASEYRSFLIPLIKLVPQLDKTNKTGLCSKYLVAGAEAQALILYSQGDVDNAVKQYLEAANNEYVKAEDKQECLYTAAYLVAFSGSEDYQGIISYLQTAYDIAPSSSKAQGIKDAITYYQTVIENIGSYEQMDIGDAK